MVVVLNPDRSPRWRSAALAFERVNRGRLLRNFWTLGIYLGRLRRQGVAGNERLKAPGEHCDKRSKQTDRIGLDDGQDQT